MKRVIIETPYSGRTKEEVQENVAYAMDCMKDSLERGEAPFLSHLLYTQVLNDNIPSQRNLGIEAGLKWGEKADLTAVYLDRGYSKGIQIGIRRANQEDRPVEYRRLRCKCHIPLIIDKNDKSYCDNCKRFL